MREMGVYLGDIIFPILVPRVLVSSSVVTEWVINLKWAPVDVGHMVVGRGTADTDMREWWSPVRTGLVSHVEVCDVLAPCGVYGARVKERSGRNNSREYV